MKWCPVLIALAVAPAVAEDGLTSLEDAAHAAFSEMPSVVLVDQIAGQCGADERVNPHAAYCTTRNIIFARDITGAAQTYRVAHLFGHAVQVQHGIADVALREIRTRPEKELELRGLVARQVDCIAGLLSAKADLPWTPLTDLFEEEPFTGSHWGRDPLRIGPTVSIGLAERADWYARGYAADEISVCAVGGFGAALLFKAYRG